MSNQPLHFSVALDLRQRSDGALAFAQWLKTTMVRQGQVSATLRGLHAIEPEQITNLRDVRSYDDMVYFANRGIQDLVARVEAKDALDETKILNGGEVDERLGEDVAAHPCDALIIGRVAPRDAELLNRLGKVARKLLRRLPVATIVVPPDLRRAELVAGSVGTGPVVVALDATDTALGACTFARKLGAALRREVVGVHVVAVPDAWGYGYVSPSAAEDAMQTLLVAGERALQEWTMHHALTDLRLIIAQGVASREIVRVAQDLDACLIVTGSRRLSTLERLFVTSVGSEVAASAQIPVAVVPTNDETVAQH